MSTVPSAQLKSLAAVGAEIDRRVPDAAVLEADLLVRRRRVAGAGERRATPGHRSGHLARHVLVTHVDGVFGVTHARAVVLRHLVVAAQALVAGTDVDRGRPVEERRIVAAGRRHQPGAGAGAGGEPGALMQGAGDVVAVVVQHDDRADAGAGIPLAVDRRLAGFPGGVDQVVADAADRPAHGRRDAARQRDVEPQRDAIGTRRLGEVDGAGALGREIPAAGRVRKRAVGEQPNLNLGAGHAWAEQHEGSESEQREESGVLGNAFRDLVHVRCSSCEIVRPRACFTASLGEQASCPETCARRVPSMGAQCGSAATTQKGGTRRRRRSEKQKGPGLPGPEFDSDRRSPKRAIAARRLQVTAWCSHPSCGR